MDEPIQNGGGEQALDWDYREVLPDLVVGDTVSFVVEVADKYPEGPHQARSESRRITFLSREEYLARIEKKKDRLLSRVRTTYRQERAAHELMTQLDPGDAGFLQTCQLEAIRQEMLRQQLKDIAGEVEALLDDIGGQQRHRCRGGGNARPGPHRIGKDRGGAGRQGRQPAPGTSRGPPPIPIPRPPSRSSTGPPGISPDSCSSGGIDSAREVLARESHMLARGTGPPPVPRHAGAEWRARSPARGSAG